MFRTKCLIVLLLVSFIGCGDSKQTIITVYESEMQELTRLCLHQSAIEIEADDEIRQIAREVDEINDQFRVFSINMSKGEFASFKERAFPEREKLQAEMYTLEIRKRAQMKKSQAAIDKQAERVAVAKAKRDKVLGY